MSGSSPWLMWWIKSSIVSTLFVLFFCFFISSLKKGKNLNHFENYFVWRFCLKKSYMPWFDEEQFDSLLVAAKRLQGLQGTSVLIILFFQGGVNVEDQNRLCYFPSSPRFESRQSMFSDWISDNNAFNDFIVGSVHTFNCDKLLIIWNHFVQMDPMYQSRRAYLVSC